MAVVINDFEVVSEPQPGADAPGESGAQAPSAAPTPHELELIHRRQEERAARVRAD